MTHDYSLSVLRRAYGPWIGEGAVTKIGDNCFIGMNSIILMGAQIGDNVIVGAGSVVHGYIPNNVVIAGNPAKIICTLEEHYNKRCESTKHEAIACAKRFKECFGKNPTPKDLEGFKFLFLPRDKELVQKINLGFKCNGDRPEEVEEAFYHTQPLWENFDEFLREAGLSE